MPGGVTAGAEIEAQASVREVVAEPVVAVMLPLAAVPLAVVVVSEEGGKKRRMIIPPKSTNLLHHLITRGGVTIIVTCSWQRRS